MLDFPGYTFDFRVVVEEDGREGRVLSNMLAGALLLVKLRRPHCTVLDHSQNIQVAPELIVIGTHVIVSELLACSSLHSRRLLCWRIFFFVLPPLASFRSTQDSTATGVIRIISIHAPHRNKLGEFRQEIEPENIMKLRRIWKNMARTLACFYEKDDGARCEKMLSLCRHCGSSV